MFKRKIETTINEYLDRDKETILIIDGARHELYYFDSKKVGEVDFLINDFLTPSPLLIDIESLLF